MQLDGMSWGPALDDGRRTVALTFENDDKVGIHFELFAFNEEHLDSFGEVYKLSDTRNILLLKRIIAVSISVGLLILVFLAQFFLIRRPQEIREDDDLVEGEKDPISLSPCLDFSTYALASAMFNSFLVGGLTFGYSGMVLMLRKEEVYAEFCSCGSFW